MSSDDLDPVLLARYFSGEGSEAEAQAVHRWIAADSRRAYLIDRLQAVWRIAGEMPSDWDVESALAAVRARGEPRVGVVPLADHAKRRSAVRLVRPAPARWRTAAVRIAAAMVIVTGVGLVWRSGGIDKRATPETATRTFTTANAEQATITLSDGTRVMLGPASTLRVPERFRAHQRDVTLEGEAYFAVARDTLRPFTVASGIGIVRVLGTKFDVRTRPEDAGVTVVVAEGHVSLGARDTKGEIGGTNVVLAAGDLGRLAPDSAPRAVHGVDVGRHLGWTEGRLVFTDTPLPVVLAELTRWYDVEFRLGDSVLARRHLTTSLRHETIPQILDVLKASLDVRWDEAGRTITLYQLHRERLRQRQEIS